MEKNEDQRVSLYQLHKLCLNQDPDALMEWERRWGTEYPNLLEIKKRQAQQRQAKNN